MTESVLHRVLPMDKWLEMQRRHRERAHSFTAEHLERRATHRRHPVWDFIFNYYPVKPAQLAQWHPGAGVGLASPSEAQTSGDLDFPTHKDHYTFTAGARSSVRVWALDTERHWQSRGKTIRYIHRLLTHTERRPAQLGCFGLHEWAMVYQDTPRHPEPLRLGAQGTNEVVEQSNLVCTHIDAFRFFSTAAAPRNRFKLTRETQPQFEQPGCLHATMDLYKWANKLGPLVPGDLWLDTFELACDVRRLDMEASPYDLREWGFDPVKIETPAGRAEYVRRQRAFSDRGHRLRRRLIEVIEGAYSERMSKSADLI